MLYHTVWWNSDIICVCVCVCATMNQHTVRMFLTPREEDESVLQQRVRSELHALALVRCRLLLLTHVVASQSH